MNHHFITGRLATQPELKTSAAGKVYASFSVACQTGFPDKETGKKKTSFFNCMIFGKPAENLCTYGFKGNLIAVRGEGQIDEYEKDGQKRREYKIMLSDYELLELGNRQDKPSTAKPAQVQQPASDVGVPSADGIFDPFG